MTTDHAVLSDMVSTMRTDLAAIEDGLSLADPSVERDLRLAGEVLDDAACRLRLLLHKRSRGLFGAGQ